MSKKLTHEEIHGHLLMICQGDLQVSPDRSIQRYGVDDILRVPSDILEQE